VELSVRLIASGITSHRPRCALPSITAASVFDARGGEFQTRQESTRTHWKTPSLHDARSSTSRGSKDPVIVNRPPFPFIWTALTHFNRPHFHVLTVAPPEASPLTWFLVQYVLMHTPELGPLLRLGSRAYDVRAC
jgi:hypothetical protein